jgi:hypothetical protein
VVLLVDYFDFSELSIKFLEILCAAILDLIFLTRGFLAFKRAALVFAALFLAPPILPISEAVICLLMVSLVVVGVVDALAYYRLPVWDKCG